MWGKRPPTVCLAILQITVLLLVYSGGTQNTGPMNIQ